MKVGWSLASLVSVATANENLAQIGQASPCDTENGGCEDKCTWADSKVTCSCETEGFRLGTDGKKCSSLVLTTQQCASTDCWSLEDDECKLREECHTYLRCSPQVVDFRYMQEKLFGHYTKDMTADIDDPCPVAESTDSMEINGVTTPVTGVDTMWRHPLGACDSTVKKITDETGVEWVEISRELSFGPEDKDTAGQDIDTSVIFFNTHATYRVQVTCMFRSEFTAKSDDIEIDEVPDHEGDMSETASWASSIDIKFYNNDFTSPWADGAKAIMGEMLFVDVAWTVGGNPLANKLNWYVPKCRVYGVDENGDDDGNEAQVILNQCYADIIDARPISTSLIGVENFRFTFRSFAFDGSANTNERLECDINFCVIDDDSNECVTKTSPDQINCDTSPEQVAYTWLRGSDVLPEA